MSIGRIEEALRKAKESRQAQPPASSALEPATAPSDAAVVPPEPRAASTPSVAAAAVAPATPATPATPTTPSRPASPPAAVIAPAPVMQFRCADGRSVEVPLARLRKNRIITARDRYRYAARFKELHAHFGRRDSDGGGQVVAVVSANPREGRTLGAINLAMSLASAGTEPVVLADMDFYKPSLHALFDLQPDVGLIDVIERRKALADVLMRADTDRLVLAPAGQRSRDHQARLSRENVGTIVAGLKSMFPQSFVIVDLPPLSLGIDTAVVASGVDHVLLVVEAGKTTRDDVQRTLGRLKNARNVVIVLNKAVENNA